MSAQQFLLFSGEFDPTRTPLHVVVRSGMMVCNAEV